ncbi:MAG TPA: MlaD family protein [Kofleriaceae bacterium]|nr:MlaD family protein [Kofleriaceae bacterium]
MVAKAQQVRVGMFAAGSLALLAFVLIVFGGMRFWEHADRYQIVFATSVIGLQPGAEVYLNGIKVGSVEALAVPPEDITKVSVTIKVKRATPVHADTKAMLQLAGITGLKVIDLRDGTTASPTLPPGSKIAAGEGLLDKLEAQAQSLADQTTQLMKRADAVMAGAGVVMERATTLTDGLIAVTAPAKTAAQNLADMSGSLKAMVDENRAGLRQTLASVKQTADSASEMIDGQVGPLFASAGDVIGELKKLLTANEGPLRAAVFDLRQASRNFKELSRDVRQRPSRLLFSSAPAERQMP